LVHTPRRQELINKEEQMKQKKWDINNIPDQEGRAAIVTGSSSGIGYETAGYWPIKRPL
jgi:hypothetical protein